MTRETHHLLCLGVLAGLHRKHHFTESAIWLEPDDLKAIEQAVESAEKELKLPVSLARLKEGLPIATDH